MLRFPIYFYNNLHPIFLKIRSIIMVTLILNMNVDNVSPQKRLLYHCWRLKRMTWHLKKNYIKRREKFDLNFKIYGTKSVPITNIYQRQKLHSHVAFGLTNTSLGITSHLRWYHSPHSPHWTFCHEVFWFFLYVFLEENISAYANYLIYFVKNFRFAIHKHVFLRKLIYFIVSETLQ